MLDVQAEMADLVVIDGLIYRLQHTTEGGTMNIEELAQHLSVPEFYVVGLINSGLLGYTNSAGEPSLEGIRHFVEYGTQWQADLQPRIEPYDERPMVKGWERLPHAVVSHTQISIHQDISVADQDILWVAHFYFRPNFFFFPDLAAMGPVGSVPVMLEKKIKFCSGKSEVFLYPDPDSRLALLAVTGKILKGVDPMVEALDAATPILNRLTAITDHALPIVQKHWIGFPSGTINLTRSSRPKPTQLDLTDFTMHKPLEDAESLYRIGLVCSEPMYRFLSFWRVYEAVDKAQGEWCGQNRRPVVEKIVSRFPEHPAFGSFAGKKFGAAISELHRVHRNAIAHGGLSGSPVHSGASAASLAEVEAAIPIIRYLAKVKIENFRHTLDQALCMSRSRDPDGSGGTVFSPRVN